tara:strand:+ start:771 stop:1784 length:1014 start_codon:yes stop_codon:yes gene_type:complete
MRKKILIIGGAGFIGHNLAIFLKKKKLDVTIVDGLNINNLEYLKKKYNEFPNPSLTKKILLNRLKLLKKSKIKFFKIDARNYKSLSKIINRSKAEIIIHLAAVSHANKSNKDPFNTFDHSFRTLENSLDNARSEKNNVKKFIFLSSSMVYGNFLTSSVNENTRCYPIGIYGSLKYAAEKLIIAYNQVFKLPFVIIRPSALYGERCISRRVGQIFIENALTSKPIEINGDGNEKLDFTYIDDLLQGIYKSIISKKADNQIFNLTYGSGRKINDLIKILKKNFKNVKVKYKKRDKLTPYRGTLSTNKAKKLLKYNSKWSIEKGYQKYINWYKDFYFNSK